VSVRYANDNRRLTQVFGKQDIHFVNRLKRALEEGLKRESFASVQDLQNYIGRSANAVQLGPLRSMKVGDVAQDLAYLLERLVSVAPERRVRIQRSLGEKLADAGVESLVEKSVSIEIPSFDQSIRVPYAYQNGRFNLIAPIEFAADVHDIFAKAGEKAIEGQELYHTSDPEHGALHLVVVAKFAEETSDSARAKVGQIFDQHNVVMHNFDNIAPLIEDIRNAAVQHGLIS
jgi:hypothetical protein